jgi:hypothetical protein
MENKSGGRPSYKALLKSFYARLYKLKKFDRFGASALDRVENKGKDFCPMRPQWKALK